MIRFIHEGDDNGSPVCLHLEDEHDTLAAGQALAAGLVPGLVIYLQGDLGAGKTTLVRGALRALGHGEKVKSPTYTLIEPYVVSRLNLYHFDFYRFATPEEYLEAGLEEYFAATGVCIVEWPDKALPYLAPPDVVIQLSVQRAGRDFDVFPQTEAGRLCTKKLLSALTP